MLGPCWPVRADLASRRLVGVGVDGERLPEQMDDLGIETAMLCGRALEQERVQVGGQAE